MSLKRAAIQVATLPPMSAILGRMLGRGPTVFTFHRFENRDLGISGHPAKLVRDGLALVRRLGVAVLPIHDAIARWIDGRLPARAVAFTADDGFCDFITHGAPLFREFDCPVTIFAAIDFVDGRDWFWWDKLRYALERTTRNALSLTIRDQRFDSVWNSAAERERAYVALVIHLKRFAEGVRGQALADATARLEVDVPARAPAAYSPMSWAECNALAVNGVTIGPHSVSHVNLARATDQESRHEIVESWRRVREVAAAPSPVFCYPFGLGNSFGPRDERFVRDAGLIGAVTLPLFGTLPPKGKNPFATPRYRFLDDAHIFAQQLTGVELLKMRVRYAVSTLRTGSPPPMPLDTEAL